MDNQLFYLVFTNRHSYTIYPCLSGLFDFSVFCVDQSGVCAWIYKRRKHSPIVYKSIFSIDLCVDYICYSFYYYCYLSFWIALLFPLHTPCVPVSPWTRWWSPLSLHLYFYNVSPLRYSSLLTSCTVARCLGTVKHSAAFSITPKPSPDTAGVIGVVNLFTLRQFTAH